MMYILTEDEYQTLREKQRLEIKANKDKLQTLCTKIADTMPVVWGWGNYDDQQDPKVWGCILSTDREWYCDKCPVRDICPNPNKAWSK